MVWIFAHRFHAEFNVARLLAPFLLAAPDYDVQLLLATQVADEHRHLQAVLRIYEEVFGVEGGIEAVRELADRNMDPVAEALYARLEHHVGPSLEERPGRGRLPGRGRRLPPARAREWWRGRRRTSLRASTSGTRSPGWPRGSAWSPATRRATSASASPTPAGAWTPTPRTPRAVIGEVIEDFAETAGRASADRDRRGHGRARPAGYGVEPEGFYAEAMRLLGLRLRSIGLLEE